MSPGLPNLGLGTFQAEIFGRRPDTSRLTQPFKGKNPWRGSGSGWWTYGGRL